MSNELARLSGGTLSADIIAKLQQHTGRNNRLLRQSFKPNPSGIVQHDRAINSLFEGPNNAPRKG